MGTFALALVVTVAGCGGVAAGPPAARTLVLIPRTSGATPAGLRGCAARTAVTLGDRLVVRPPARASASARIVVIDAVIAMKPSAVMIDVRDSAALAASIQSMHSAGIQVLTPRACG